MTLAAAEAQLRAQIGVEMFTFDMSFEQYAESMKVSCTCRSVRFNVHTADCSLIRLHQKWSQGSQELWEVIKQKELLKQKERAAKEATTADRHLVP